MGRIGHALLLLLALAQGVWAQAPVAGAVAGAGAGTSGAPARSTPAQATGSAPAAAPGTATGAAPGAAPSGTPTGQVGAPAAELRNVTGVVFVQSVGSQARIVQAGTTLVVGDTVGTNKGAFALIVFNDGSRVALRPESAIAIKGFSFKPEDPSADQMSVQLLKGWLRNVSGQIGKRGNRAGFELRVVDSTIGIRGTDFAVRYCDAECAAAPATDTEGVLPQSGRLGSLLASDAGVQRLLDGQAPQVLSPGDVLRLGDVIETTVSEALIGLDDGTRVVMGPATRLALRAEEDERGRRALRLDVLQGTVRVATPPQPGARLYGLLLNAGQLLGVRQDSALDLRCEQAAEPGAFSCASAVVNLRRGRSEVLTDTGLRSLRPGVPERLAEPGVPAATPSAPFLPPNVPGTPPLPVPPSPPVPATPPADSAPLPVDEPPSLPQSGHTDWDTWAPDARPISAWRTLTRWEAQQSLQAEAWRWPGPEPRLAQLSPPGTETPGPGPRTSAMFDPLDLPADLTRPPSTAQVAVEGIYTAVFSGLIELANPAASILIAAGQGGFAPIVPTLPPQLLPTAPAFLERDRELERGRLYPEQCPR